MNSPWCFRKGTFSKHSKLHFKSSRELFKVTAPSVTKNYGHQMSSRTRSSPNQTSPFFAKSNNNSPFPISCRTIFGKWAKTVNCRSLLRRELISDCRSWLSILYCKMPIWSLRFWQAQKNTTGFFEKCLTRGSLDLNDWRVSIKFS